MCTPTRDEQVRAHAEGSQLKDKGEPLEETRP